jgi:hypothetical protein
VRTHLRKPEISYGANTLEFHKDPVPDLPNELQGNEPNRLVEAEKMSAIGIMSMLNIPRSAPLAFGDLCERRVPRAPRFMCERAG